MTTIDPPRVALVGCGKAKASETKAALHLYTGRLFRAAVDLALATHDELFIVSALHGLVDPDKELAPYEFTIAQRPVEERAAWGADVARALHDAMGGVPFTCTVLMGESYARHLRPHLPTGTTYPLERVVGVGPRIVWLRDKLAEAGGLPC